MKAFAQLYARLEETNKTQDKVAALRTYLAAARPADAAWAVFFLIGRKPRQVVPTRKLATWAAAEAGIPDWLFEECYQAVGDLAETIALILPLPQGFSDLPLAQWIEEHLLPLREADEASQRDTVLSAWSQFDSWQRFVWNKLITGSFRVGVSQQLVIRALAEAAQLPPAVVAHRLMGDWQPTSLFFGQLCAADEHDSDISRPYPFFLAHPLEGLPANLGDIDQWQFEWKWDGIRSQLVRRAGRTFLWSRGEELVTDRYPELAAAADKLPDGTVLDGEILPWRDGVLPFGHLQRRIGRKTLSKKLLAEVPVVLMTYDLLEQGGIDVRALPLLERRERLARLIDSVADSRVLLSPLVAASSWDVLERERQTSRSRNVEGIMLKRKDSPYRAGRQRGDWWKWKIGPYSIDAVLIYAQPGNGKRASLYTDYTFGLWDADRLVPVAKAYSGLTDEEIRQVDAFVRRHTLETLGPVRTVKPELVFELGFEGIQRSARHKSGVAVRFPRMLRWRRDKNATEADTLETLLHMLPSATNWAPDARAENQLLLFADVGHDSA
jgi:DNA ligase-1